MVSWLLRESGAQHPGSAKGFECGVYGALTDKKGAEQIYLHAQRDWDENIEHDQKIRVGNERHDTVEANVLSEFKVEEHRITHLDRKSEMRADDHLTVGATQHVKIGTAQFVEAGTEIHYHAGSKSPVQVSFISASQRVISVGSRWRKA